MRKRKKYYQDIYEYDPKRNAYIIEVSLDVYEEIFDDWDPAPFKSPK